MSFKKRFFIILLVMATLGVFIIADGIRGLGFKAPTINGKDNVYNPEVGEIVYDSSDANFYGRSQNNSWLSFTGGGGSDLIGSIVMWPTETVPTGYLECNGQAVSRTTYSSLFAALGTRYGSGDGSSTFNLPDFRGLFPRGRDNGAGMDPDADSRTDRGDGTTGDVVGTKQDSENKSHAHNAEGGAFLKGTGGGTYWQHVAVNGQWPVYYDSTISYTGVEESRPRNISMVFIIRAN